MKYPIPVRDYSNCTGQAWHIPVINTCDCLVTYFVTGGKVFTILPLGNQTVSWHSLLTDFINKQMKIKIKHQTCNSCYTTGSQYCTQGMFHRIHFLCFCKTLFFVLYDLCSLVYRMRKHSYSRQCLRQVCKEDTCRCVHHYVYTSSWQYFVIHTCDVTYWKNKLELNYDIWVFNAWLMFCHDNWCKAA